MSIRNAIKSGSYKYDPNGMTQKEFDDIIFCISKVQKPQTDILFNIGGEIFKKDFNGQFYIHRPENDDIDSWFKCECPFDIKTGKVKEEIHITDSRWH